MIETTLIQFLQSAATANGNGTKVDVEGLNRVRLVEVVESGGGTCTLALQGSFDGTNWYACGYEIVDNTASPARAVANLSVAASGGHVYQLLDMYPQVRAVISAIAGGGIVAVRLFAAA